MISLKKLFIDRPFPSAKMRRRQGAFSIVEVVFALGILSFGLVGLIGLLPAGLTAFQGSMDSTICTQISQKLLNEAQQTDFDQLMTINSAIRYFDDQGEEVSLADKSRAVYETKMGVVASTNLPGSPANQNIATVLVQIAKNRGTLSIAAGANGLWSSSQSVPVSNHSAYVARNK